MTLQIYFGFKKFFIVDEFAKKINFNAIAYFIPNILIFFNKSSSSILK